MNAKDAINNAMDISGMVLQTYIGDLSDTDLMVRPGPGCNHLAWQLGHLISSQCGLMSGIQPGSAPELPAGFKEQHSKENSGSDDPTKFCTKQQYVDLMNQVNAATKSLLASYPEANLDSPSPEDLRKFFPTMGQIFVLIATHPMMHAGQFVPVRRALGKPVVM